MQNRLARFYLVISLFLFSGLSVFAQTTTLSPYSIFGLGEIEYQDLGRNSGMGSVGIGLQSNQSLNRINPASYSALDSLSFTGEVSVMSKYSHFTNGRLNQNNVLATFKKLAFGFRVNNFWATSLGLAPYSYMGYDIGTQKDIQGSDATFNVNHKGDGAINKLYIANSFSIGKHFAVGFNTSLNFGTLYQNEESYSPLFSSTFKYSEQNYVNKLTFDYGAQYTGWFSDKLKYTIGGIYGNKNTFKLDHSVTVNVTGSDVKDEDKSYTSNEIVPMFWGTGASLIFSNGLSVAGDYFFQKWSDKVSTLNTVKFVDNKRVSFGVEYRPNVRIPKNYFQRMYYQAGFIYNRSYIQLRGQQINETAFSAGFGLPIKSDRSYFSISFQAGERGKLVEDLFKERYFQVNLNLIFRDIWFLKSRFD